MHFYLSTNNRGSRGILILSRIQARIYGGWGGGVKPPNINLLENLNISFVSSRRFENCQLLFQHRLAQVFEY